MDVKLKAKTYEEFVQEHIEWTDLLDEINSNTTVTHIYKKDFLNYRCFHPCASKGCTWPEGVFNL